MMSSNIFSILLSIVFTILCIQTVEAQDSPPEITKDRAQVVKDLLSSNSQKSRQAVEYIRANKDPIWLKELAPLLDTQEGTSRQIVTMLVLGVFPEDSLSFFANVAKSPSRYSREAAMYGLARVMKPGVEKELIQGLRDSDEKVRNAALRGIQLLCRPDGGRLFTALLNSDSPPFPPPHPAFEALQIALQNHENFEPKDSWKGVWHEVSTRTTIRSIQDKFLTNLSDESQRTILQRVFQSASPWASKPLIEDSLVYDFSMVNVVAGSSKEIHIDATPEEINRTRFLGYDIDRAVHLRMAVDLWLQAPQLYTKKIEVVDDEIIIHLNLKGSPYLHAGVGLLNISYWESRVSNGLEAQVVFDVNTGKWLREQVISDKNNQVWNTVCSDWISGNPELPGKITIEMPQGQVGARLYPLTFRAFFDRQGKQWHLTKATMHEQITDESGSTSQQLRALAELKLTVTKEKQKPDHSGQGSKGKSPKE